MDIYTNAWIFQDDATTTGNGNIFKSGRNDQITVYVKNTNAVYELVFEGCDGEAIPTWYAIPAIKLPDLTTVTSTTIDGAFVINLAHFAGVRCRISSISGGGSLRVTGRAVNLGGSSLTNIPNDNLSGLIGEVQASPTANTLLARVKNLLTGIVLAAGNNLIGKVGVDQTTDGTTNRVVAKISQETGENFVQLSGSKVCLSSEAKPAGEQGDTLLEYDEITGETKVYKYISGDWREL